MLRFGRSKRGVGDRKGACVKSLEAAADRRRSCCPAVEFIETNILHCTQRQSGVVHLSFTISVFEKCFILYITTLTPVAHPSSLTAV